ITLTSPPSLHDALPIFFSSHLLPGFMGLGFITTTGSSATPSASLGLVFPLVPRLPAPSYGTLGASPGKSTCPALKPSVLTCRAIQLSGFPIRGRVTHSTSQPRFAYAMFQGTPSASSRPYCCQWRPCLLVTFPLVGR